MSDPRLDGPLERLVAEAGRAIDILIALAIVALVVAVAFGSGEARAQASSAPTGPWRCAPKTALSPTACGTPYRYVLEAEGECEVWWSMDSPTSWNIERRCCLHKYCGANAIDPGAIVRRIASHASGVLVAINEEARRMSVKPANAQESYDYALLRWKACEDARINVALMILPAASAPTLPAAWCGPAPTPPAPAPALSPYVVTPAGVALTRPAYPVLAGKRSTTATGSAVPGQPCDCAALQIIEFNVVRYCASPSITGISGSAVTACTARR
jgi:hypothetical protein